MILLTLPIMFLKGNATNVTRPLSQPSNPNSMVWLRLFPSSYGDFFNLAVFLVETKRYHRVRTTVRRLNNKVDSLEAKINRILKWTQQQPQQLPQQLSQQQLSRQQIRGLFQLRKRR